MDTDIPETPEGERIAKVLSRAGIASRRDAERMILDGRVTVNGRVVTSPAVNVGPGDRLAVDGARVAPPEPTRLWLYHKPAGVITTTVDEEGRETVFEGLPEDMPRVMAVGRLDLNSEGLLLLTNDGGVKRRLELPASGLLRRYRVRINGTVSEAQLERLRAGVTVEGVDYAPMEARFDRQQGANAWLTVGLREGKNREIRRVMDYLGVTVNRLIRVSYGPFQLGELEPWAVREVTGRALRDQLGLGEADDEQVLTRRTRGERPVKVRRLRTGPVMRSTTGGPRPGEGGGGPAAGKPDGKVAGKPAGKVAGKVAGTRSRPPGPAGAPVPQAGAKVVKPARAGHTADRPGRSPAKAAAIAAARAAAADAGAAGGSGVRKPRSAGFRSHGAPGRSASADGAGGTGRSAGYKSHRDAAAGGPPAGRRQEAGTRPEAPRTASSGKTFRQEGAAGRGGPRGARAAAPADRAAAGEGARKPRHKAGAGGAPAAAAAQARPARADAGAAQRAGRAGGGAAPKGPRRGPGGNPGKGGSGGPSKRPPKGGGGRTR